MLLADANAPRVASGVVELPVPVACWTIPSFVVVSTWVMLSSDQHAPVWVFPPKAITNVSVMSEVGTVDQIDTRFTVEVLNVVDERDVQVGPPPPVAVMPLTASAVVAFEFSTLIR